MSFKDNPRVTAKERNLLKGSMRRVFSRSELRNQVMDEGAMEHSDPSRKRVKHWRRCNECKKPEAKSNCVVDHITPVIPVNSSFVEMSLDETADSMWCDKANLQILCDTCHTKKTKSEAVERRLNKKAKKENTK